ncbi:cytosine permease [Streptomyces hoynatensis]|uniref:Cytosine permease n=1 Tax=Streptomyces hoynatensis TaxID=1141874 RepID=A0A3A9Z6T6_9ACTN|nr:cytosine permease [Streptomyces hoynatensis]RKN44025.1 cytosine permease [Streptomyces hoynatensis]
MALPPQDTVTLSPPAPGPAGRPASPGDEFEDRPVPLTHRRPLRSVSSVWFGFPMVLTNAVFGGVIVFNLGFARGMAAILLGCLILGGYVGALSHLAGRTGDTFARIAAVTFGGHGARLASAFLATVVIGWFAFQVGLTGATLHAALGWPTRPTVLLAGVLYVAVAWAGIRALSVIGWIAAPLYLVLGAVAIALALRDASPGDVLSYEGQAPAGGALAFGACVTMVVAAFIDSGTMTADFTRWSRNGREAVLAALTAFPVANLLALLVGAVVVGAGAAAEPATAGGDFLGLLTGRGGLLTAAAVVFVFANLGSVSAHCLYNAAVGWGQLTGVTMRRLVPFIGLLGLAVALAGVWEHFETWLTLLGVFVPPIGAVLLTDQLAPGAAGRPARRGLRPVPLAAWAVGAALATLVHYQGPQYCEAAVGLLAAALVQFAGARLGRAPRGPRAATRDSARGTAPATARPAP